MPDGSDEHALLLQISYDLARLQKQGSSAEGVVDKSLSNMEKRAKKAAQNLEEAMTFKSANLEGALAEVLSSSRLRVLDSATTKVGLFGGALESLGPIGLTAAAGIGAVGAAIGASLKIGDWALDLQKSASALGFTTTQLQQFRLVAAAGGVDADKLTAGLSGINQTIGNLESGLVRGKQLTEFVSKLGISPDQLRSWGTFGDQLPHVLDALAKLNPQERAGLAAHFKIDPETLNDLVELRGDLDGVATSQAGQAVMSAAQVKQYAALQLQIRETSAVISNNLRVAMINMEPVVLGVMGFIERFSSGLAALAYNARLTTAALAGTFTSIGSFISGHGFTNPLAGAFQVYNDAHAPDPKEVTPPPTKVITPKTPKTPRAKSRAGAERRSDDDLDAADKLLADAQKALATSFDARAKFETDALTAEETKAQQKLSADLKTAKTGPERAQIERAQTETTQAYVLKRQLVANTLAQQIAEQTNAIDALRLTGADDLLRAQDALGGTLAQHAAVALQIFDNEETIARAKAQEVIDSKTASDAEKERAALELANLNATAPDRRQKVVNDNAIAASDQAGELRQAALQTQIDQLDAEKGVLQTTENRRKIALQLFALDEQLQEDKLREQIAAAQLAGETEKASSLQGQLASLQSTAGLRGQAVDQANPGDAFTAWANEAKASTADVAQSFAQMKVGAIDSFNDALFNSEGKLNSLSSIARKVSQSMITDFEKFAVKSVEGGLFGGGGAGPQGASNPISGAAGAIGKLFGLGGGKGSGLGGVTQPGGTASNPFYVIPADTSGGGLTNGWSGLFGGGSGSGSGTGSSGLFGSINASSIGNLFGGGSSASGAGGLGSLFGGGSGGGSLLSSIGSLIPGFAGGGAFTVGGKGGVDRNLAMMKLSAGERVTVETPQQQRDAQAGGIGNVTQHFNFPGANPDGFRRSQRQWARGARMAMQYGG